MKTITYMNPGAYPEFTLMTNYNIVKTCYIPGMVEIKTPFGNRIVNEKKFRGKK